MASISTTAIPPPPLPSPSPTTIVHFPRRQWTTFDAKWTLTLTVTAELAWDVLGGPSGSNQGVFRSKRVAAARVVELVRAGRLWIGSGGRSVDLTARPMLTGKPVLGTLSDNDDLRDLFLETILEWPIWDEKLGLRVKSRNAETETEQLVNDTTLLYFTVNHPPSPNGLYTPSRTGGGIPLARLQRVSCQLELNHCADGFHLPHAPVPTKKGKSRAKKPAAKSKSKSKSRSRNGTAPSRPKKKPPPLRKNLRPRPSENARQMQQREVIDPRDVLLVGSPSWKQATALIETGLHILVGVSGKQGPNRAPVPGIRPADDVSAPNGAPSLLDVAPAVWNNHYFTAVSSRAPFVPLIHRFLAGFTNAQSPSLRRKAEALTQGGTNDFGQEIGPEGVLGTKLEEILLKAVMQLPLRTSKKSGSRLHGGRNEVSQEAMSVSRPTQSSYMPISPGLSQESPQVAIDLPELERSVYESDEDQLVDLNYDNLEAFVSLTPEDDADPEEQPREWGDYMEGELDEYDYDDEVEAQELNWQDIEAWSEPDQLTAYDHATNEYHDDDEEDGLFEEINEDWSPEGLEGGIDEAVPDTYGDPYGADSEDEESGLRLWQDMQAWQLDEWQEEEEQQEENGQPMYRHDMGYMDDEDDIHFMDICEEDFDEGVGLWRDENDIINDCC